MESSIEDFMMYTYLYILTYLPIYIYLYTYLFIHTYMLIYLYIYTYLYILIFSKIEF